MALLKNRAKEREARHEAELVAMGAGKGALDKLRRIERDISKFTTAACNGEISERALDGAIRRTTKRIAEVFGGKVPAGFFINQDPRGFALKIDDEVVGRDHMPISYTDWGGYGILAPGRSDFKQ